MVVIMAAGRGSRMGLPEGVSKCSATIGWYGKQELCSVTRLILQVCNYSNERDFVVVVGYGSESLISKIEDFDFGDYQVNIKFCSNNKWMTDGSGRSLQKGLCSVLPSTKFKEDENLYLFEGDAVYCDSNIQALLESQLTCVLVRSEEYLTTSSVAVLMHPLVHRILSFLYDKTHQTQMGMLRNLDMKVFDSMQAWKLKGHSDIMTLYYVLVDCTDVSSTNLDGLNLAFALGDLKMTYCLSKDPEGWVNLNTSEDLIRAQRLVLEESRASSVSTTNKVVCK